MAIPVEPGSSCGTTIEWFNKIDRRKIMFNRKKKQKERKTKKSIHIISMEEKGEGTFKPYREALTKMLTMSDDYQVGSTTLAIKEDNWFKKMREVPTSIVILVHSSNDGNIGNCILKQFCNKLSQDLKLRFGDFGLDKLQDIYFISCALGYKKKNALSMQQQIATQLQKKME